MNAHATACTPLPRTLYQLYASPPMADVTGGAGQLPWKPTEVDRRFQPVLSVAHGQSPVWATVDGPRIRTVDGPGQAAFGLRVVGQKVPGKLVLLTLDAEVLVNGAPAPGLVILGVRDSIYMVSAELVLYVTERFRPFLGCPTEEPGLVGQECPACAIEIQAEPATQVVTCRCGAVYHHETAESHPHVPVEERLDCASRIKACLRCEQELTTEEKLVWDPATLS